MRAIALVLATAMLIGCADASPHSWGPLAVARLEGAMQARNVGSIVINETCVFLERDGERELLVWPAGQTTWSSATGEIGFLRRDGDVVTVRNGQRTVLGGGGSSPAEGGLDGAAWAAQFDWVAAPAEECLVGSRWVVSDVEPN